MTTFRRDIRRGGPKSSGSFPSLRRRDIVEFGFAQFGHHLGAAHGVGFLREAGVKLRDAALT